MKNLNQYVYKQLTSKISISAFALGSVLVISGCSNSLVNNQPMQAVDQKPIANKVENAVLLQTDRDYIAADDSASTTEGILQVVSANNQFAIDLYQQLNKQPNQSDKNVFFSPYSLSTAMAMLYAAAEAETRSQIGQTFHYPSPTILNPNSAALYNQFNQPNSNYDLSTVNDLWLRQDLRPNQAYLDIVQRYYGGQVTNLNFMNNPEPSRQTINKKIAQHTNQLIPELLPKNSIQPDTATVLTNAVYFKGDWKMPFEVQSTSTQPFYNQTGASANVEMMQLQSYFDYTEDDQAQIVQLPYKGDDLSMLVVLPKSKDKAAMQQLVQNLNASKIKQWSADLVGQEVNLHLPKFKLEEGYDMKALLSNMGMARAFREEAEFNLFDERPPIKIDDVYHKAVVIVDETGTEAAAATGIVAVVTSMPMNPPVVFKADHPFIFMIKDNKTDAILFLGQVNKL
ncbi:serpin family protein [uncultured Psychrobacter sp.]|uniref:serpin family protein n=1 Tax=uncultured Psychrobacter sp. TaxID=259303 RepID=UPI00345B45B1